MYPLKYLLNICHLTISSLTARCQVQFLISRSVWGQVLISFPCGSTGKKSACNVGDLGSIPGLGRSPGEGKGYPLQYSGLENSMDCIVHGVAKTRLSDFHFHFSRC